MGGDETIPPRNGEGDHAKRGGGVFATSRRTIDLARRQRRSGNLPKVVLWRALRERPGGFKFRRQHPIDRFSLDFACLEARLAIEVDGADHSFGDQPTKDAFRNARLSELGFRTLRVSARDALGDADAVAIAIVAACIDRLPLHRPADGPPPRSGEVL